MKYSVGWIAVLTIWSALKIAAQEPVFHFRHINIDKGLHDNQIASIYQDKSLGYLWFSTNQGLERYDGYHIRLILIDSTLTKKQTNIGTLSEGKDHVLYVPWNKEGLFCLNLKSGKV